MQLAKQFFEMDLDPHFRSTITEARLYFALYKNWEQEVEDVYLKQGILSDVDLKCDAAVASEPVGNTLPL